MTGYKYYSFHRDIFCGSCRQFGRFSFLSGRDFCFVRLCFLFLRIFFSFCWDNFCAFSGKFVRNFYSICRFFYQPFRYFSVPGAFFLPILCRHLPCFPRNFDFSSGIFYILRMSPVVFLSAISAFFSSRSIFSACFVQAPAVFFPVILIFHLESFVFCGYCLPFFHLIPVFFVLLLNFFLRKSLFFSASASHSRVFFPHLSNHFQAFFRAVWEIFLSISIIFPLFSGLSGGKIHISRNGFSVCLLSPERNFSTIPVFLGSWSVFSACFVQVPAVFLPRHSDFFIRNLLRFTDAVCRVFSSHTGILGFPERFFCLFCAGSCRLFSPSSRFSSEIFHILRMLLAVFLLVILVFFGSRSIFSACFVQAPAVFFPRHPDFHLKSFTFCGCCLPCFFQPYRYFGVSGAFFLPVLCRLLPCFSPVIPIFIRNLLRFTDAACCFFISHSGIFRFLKHFFLPVLCRRLPCFFLSSRFSSGIFCVLRMLPVVFFPAISVFLGFRSVFSAGLVQAPAVFFPRHPDFHLKSFTFYGCCLPCFFQPYRHFFPFFCLSRLWKTSCFPVFVRTFCMEPTRAHSHARNNILSSLSGFLFLLPQDMP